MHDTVLVCFQDLRTGSIVERMSEIEVNQHTTLWLSVLSPDKVLIISVNIPQECFTEVVVIAVVVHNEVLAG